MAAQRDAFPVSPARPELASKRATQIFRPQLPVTEAPSSHLTAGLRKKVHPLLQRFAEEEPLLAEAESRRPDSVVAPVMRLSDCEWPRSILDVAAALGIPQGDALTVFLA